MPSLKAFQVKFDRPNATYMPGETVSGKIIVNISREKKIRSLYINAKGEARVSWNHSQNRRDINGKTRIVNSNFTNSEEYFYLQFNVVTNDSADEERHNSQITILPGHHEYPFSFQLPHSIPSSFEHSYGYIRYTVKAVIDRPWKFNHESKAAFTVISHLDLNKHRSRCFGVQDEVMGNFCCLCVINQGSLKVDITIPCTGYVPGQSVNTLLDYKNSSSSVNVTKITTKISKKITFYAASPYRKTQTVNTVLKVTSDSGPFPARNRVVSNIVVPPIPPSRLQYCSIIDLEYQLIVSVHVSGPHSKIQRTYPLLIGTVPLYCPSAPPLEDANVLRVSTIRIPEPSEFIPPYSQTGDQNRQMGFVPPQQASTSDVNLNIPPPSYEECISGTQHIKEPNDSGYVFGANSPFVPRYPVFNYPTMNARNQ